MTKKIDCKCGPVVGADLCVRPEEGSTHRSTPYKMITCPPAHIAPHQLDLDAVRMGGTAGQQKSAS